MDVAPVIGQHDVSASVFAELLSVIELALCDPLLPSLIAYSRHNDARSIEPMLDFVLANRNLGGVPLPCPTRLDRFVGLVKIVERGSFVLAVDLLTVGVVDLVFAT